MLKFSIEADNIDNSLISDYTPYFPTSEMMQKSYEALKKLKAKIDKKGYDHDWSDGMHQRLMENLYKQYLHKKLNAKIMICCYVNLSDLKNDLYCRYLLRMGFTLYLLQDAYLPQIYSKKIKDKIESLEKERKKKKVVECVFINYEPIAQGIVVPERIKNYEDVFV